VLFQLIGPKERAYEFKAGLVKNPDHYSGYVDKVKYLKQQEKLDEAETLLLQLVGETEEESRRASSGVAPWYYEQLAIIYRKQKRHADELAILERYEAQRKARGVGPDKLAARLEKVRA
jgi:hypothetical protein